MNFYNEHDPRAAAWLRELIKQGCIPAGVVDERSIVEIKPDELHQYTQCHFFAGIGGWSYALQLAGWCADIPVWTGSCPCQPFSTAGQGKGQEDERHLWPAFFELIHQCRPEHVFGEQVANAIGRGWLDGISTDLEAEDYACGAAVLGAHSVGAPHIRQRLYWMAISKRKRRSRGEAPTGAKRWHESENGSSDVWMANNNNKGSQGWECEELPEYTKQLPAWEGSPFSGRITGAWDKYFSVGCRDGKSRRVPTEPRFFPLAHGVPGRVGLLRGYGNAIVPQTAAAFIQAYCSL